ncbi:uroporphyrinogen decarboxylase [Rhodopirellula maiorica SM1]|uniref:Uroporphyrinogen decarboxylase n=1 Tax=Rhodopirellula maiorica SM1 TaxID=1265738 RepID=M5RNH7_9BACT|nr:uroporphyrinogen decarboxylase [Rhodopirellula maiorica]EMI20845.1 uroporphyrinogen decarboxylase [Rhodopirellula maiorica SM1]
MEKAPANFDGLNVAALESRRADDMARMITRHGGVAHVSPSMREVPIDPNRPAIDFAYRVMTGEVNVVVLMTGVGFRFLLRAIERHVDQQRFLDALSDITTICRGPKPAAAMREFGLTTTYRVPEPNTWRELLQTIDANVSIANQVVGVQEYGVSNASLVAGLEARGATVETVRVYGWEFPESTEALEENVNALAAGKRDMLLVTSAHQVVNVLRMAEELNMVDDLRRGLHSTVIASIGPTTSEMLRECELHVDFEPSHPKMGHLVTEAARQSNELTKAKRRVKQIRWSEESKPQSDTMPPHPSDDSLFMKACRGEATERTPVWLMRQAGRYMSEYREVRAKQSFLELCANPKLCSEVMCTAVDRLGVDAAIIFSDLLPLLVPMGFNLEFVAGDGPVIHNPVRCGEDLARVRALDKPEKLDFVYETVRQTRADLPESIPLIGFAGSPFTLASYAIEGGGSRQYTNTKKLMHSDAGAWADLMNKLSESITVYLNHQIAAGAQCVQLFDSWAGCLSPSDYSKFVLPWMKQIIAGIDPSVPVINFATGNPELLPLLRGDRRTVVGVDWRISLDVAWQRIGHDCAVQGNMDPSVLLADPDVIRETVDQLLQSVDGRPGHIFNLGHGVLKETPVENVIALVETVKELSQR